jgi:hypothetical protein
MRISKMYAQSCSFAFVLTLQLNASWDREVEEESRHAQGRANRDGGRDGARDLGRDTRQLEVVELNKV